MMGNFKETSCCSTMSSKDTTVSKLVATLVVALLGLKMAPLPACAAGKLQLSDLQQRRLLQELPPVEPVSIAINLMSVDHIASPYSQPGRTRKERFLMAMERSRRRTQSQLDFTSPLEFDFSGHFEYIMEITLGTPPRTLMVVADTGSDLSWIQCQGCSPCAAGAPDPYFDPSASSSYSIVPCTDTLCPAASLTATLPCPANSNECDYDYSYNLGYSVGTLSQETITVTSTDGSSTTIPGYYFGCGYNQSNAFTNLDGLVGLGQGNLSLVVQLGAQINEVFSYCLVAWEPAMEKTSSLVLGSAGTLPLVYTPLVPNPNDPSSYYVRLLGITVGGTPLVYPSESFDIVGTSGGVILDSGTTAIVLDDRVYTPFTNALKDQISYPNVSIASAEFPLCFDTTGVTNPEFPKIEFQLQDVNLVLPVENVFEEVDNEDNPDAAGGIFCAFVSSTPMGGRSYLGNIFQQNFQIAYDLLAQRVGFAATTC